MALIIAVPEDGSMLTTVSLKDPPDCSSISSGSNAFWDVIEAYLASRSVGVHLVQLD